MNKIVRRTVEGRIFQQSWKKICKILIRLTSKIDYYIGILARNVMLNRTPIDNNKVFFYTQEMRYTCNPKYICEELIKKRPDIEIVWRAPTKGRGGIPQDINIVRLNTYDYFKAIFTSKIIVANSFLYVGKPFWLKKKQVLIQTWHGSLGIKRHDKNAMKDKVRKKALKRTGKMTNYCISNSSLETGSLKSTYWEDSTFLEYGHARNDIFFDNHIEDRKEIKAKIFEMYGLDEDINVVMYAPTFRDSKSLEYYNIDFDRLLNNLQKRFGGKWCAFLKYHPSLRKYLKKMDIDILGEDIIDVTNHDDMQELIAVTDVAITDYSSWIYDFVLMKKPGFIFATDIELYNNERGFYYPLEETPFYISTNNDELESSILDFDYTKYEKDVDAFLESKGCIEDGHASERVVELISQLIDGCCK